MLRKVLFLIITNTFLIAGSYASSDFSNSIELRNKYPGITQESTRAENKNILCPFHRMIERSGLYDKNNKPNRLIVSISTIIRATKEFGCKVLGCTSVATAVSISQNTYLSDVFSRKAIPTKVNLTRLHRSRGIAHECGFTFKKGGTRVSESVRAKTLNRLSQLSNKGTLLLEDLFTVKKEICKSQNVKMTGAGKLEVELIFNYLGGADRGFIELSDVDRFFHATMPLTKSIDGV